MVNRYSRTMPDPAERDGRLERQLPFSDNWIPERAVWDAPHCPKTLYLTALAAVPTSVDFI